MAQVRAMRSPHINAQIIQQKRLIKFKDLHSYLSRAHPTLASEITQAYINTMRWYYASNFTRYLQALEKIKIHPSDRNEVLGGDPSAQRGRRLSLNLHARQLTPQETSFHPVEQAQEHMIRSL